VHFYLRTQACFCIKGAAFDGGPVTTLVGNANGADRASWAWKQGYSCKKAVAGARPPPSGAYYLLSHYKRSAREGALRRQLWK